MAEVKPFCAIRPAPGKEAMVPSHPIESYLRSRIKEIIDTNPFSYLRIIYAGSETNSDKESQLHHIKYELNKFIVNGILIRDTVPCYYIYRQIKKERSHTGIIALASLDDYESGVIRIHELTLSEREHKLKEYLSITEINAEPVSIAYPYNKKIDALLTEKIKYAPLYDYEYDDIRHTVWRLMDTGEIKTMEGLFSEIPFLYIADGHHRAASSYLLRQDKMMNNTISAVNKPFNYFMAAFFADHELSIFNYNRVISDLNGNTRQSMIKKLSSNFFIKSVGTSPFVPALRGEITMYMEHEWYSLIFNRNNLLSEDPLKLLDVSILNDYILNPLFGIVDLRKDQRIAFLPGTKGTGSIINVVDSGKYKVGFCLYPLLFDDLKEIADSSKEMPPKSTWIEPKLESGLLVYSFSR